ncbi:MAG: hypothetical protein WCX46_04020 [Candidatus Paceibacterota bacterium]
MQNIKLGNLDEDSKSINDVEKALKRVNIEIRETPTTFRNMSDVLEDVARQWSSFDDVTKASIAQALAGTRQYENLIALLENWSTAEKLKTEEMNASGLATQRYQTYLESLEAATNRFTAAWEELWMKTISSGFIKWIVDAGTGIVNFASDVGGLIPILTLAVSLLIAFNAQMVADTIIKFVSGISKAIVAVKNLTTEIGLLKAVASMSQGGFITLAISLAATAGALAWMAYNANSSAESLKKHAEAVDKLKSEIDDLNSSVQKSKEDIDSIGELGRKYEELKVKTAKTSDEQKKFRDVQNDLKKILPEINGYYDDEGNFLVDNAVKLDDLLGLKREQIRVESELLNLKTAESEKEKTKAYEDQKNVVKDLTERLASAEKGAVRRGKGRIIDPEEVARLKKELDDANVELRKMGLELQLIGQNVDNVNKKRADWTKDDTAEQSYKSTTDTLKSLLDVVKDYNDEKGLSSDQLDALKQNTDDYTKYIVKEGDLTKLNKKAYVDYAVAKYDLLIANLKLQGGTEELITVLKKEQEELKKTLKIDLSDTLSGLTSVSDKILSIIDDAKEYGQISAEQVQELAGLYPEDYLKFLIIEGNQYKLNTEALKAFVIQKAEDAKATAIRNGATQQEIAVLQAYIDQLRNGVPFSAKKAEDAIKEYNDAIKKQEEAYQDLLDDTIDMLKEKAEAEKDALQEKLDGYKAVIDAQKEAIDREEDEHDYNKEMEDKKKKVSDIEAEIAELQFDTSLEAAAKRKKLEEELAEAREDLEETEHDRSVNLQKEALDDEYERYKAYIDQKVKDIEDYLKNTGQLTSEAIDLLNGKSGEFYNSLLEWNKKFGTGIDEDIIAKWQKAFEVIQQYQQAAQNAGAGSGTGENQEETPEEKEEPKLLAIGTRVKMDGSLYSDSEGQGEGATINGDNYNGRPLIVRDYKEGMTAPYLINNLGWAKMDSVKAYHTGMEEGFVGGRSLLKSNEQFAKLMKGEAVINSQQMDNFVSNILPSIASSGGGDIKSEINIAINGNLDKSVLPKLEDIVNKSIEKLNQTMDRRGYKRNATNFAI